MNTSYLNLTENKDARTKPVNLVGVVWHETGSHDKSPIDTLDWNLKRSQMVNGKSQSVASSYNYLIALDGTVYRYVDEAQFVAWHAGLASAKPAKNAVWEIDGTKYVGYEINVHCIGVEMDGAIDGTPITAQQRDSAILLMIYFRDAYGIPIDTVHHAEHKALAPGYKYDPKAYSVAMLVDLAQAKVAQPAPAPTPPPPPPPTPPAPIISNVIPSDLLAALQEIAVQQDKLTAMVARVIDHYKVQP